MINRYLQYSSTSRARSNSDNNRSILYSPIFVPGLVNTVSTIDTVNTIDLTNINTIELEDINEQSERSISINANPINIDEEIVLKVDKEVQTDKFIITIKSDDINSSIKNNSCKKENEKLHLIRFVLFCMGLMVVFGEFYHDQLSLMITINGFCIIMLSLFFTKIFKR
jgi:hypothetical protein